MYVELALIAVVVSAGYWGWFFTRHRPGGSLVFGAMQLGAAALAAAGLVGREVDAPLLGALGAVGLGAGACLLVVAPLLRGLARRAAAAERLGVAAALLGVAQHLAPGLGIAEELGLLVTLREIREGRIERTLSGLVAARARAGGAARRALDERIAMLYLAALRWDDAIAHAEAHLLAAPTASAAPGAAGAPDDDAPGPGGGPGEGAVRRALGMAPAVWVELSAAYGRRGDLETAARMVARLEDVCAGRPEAGALVHRARLTFLALAGRVEAVAALVERPAGRHLAASTRRYWVAVAHERRGEAAAAAAAYRGARARARRGRQRALIDEALARLDAAPRAVLAGSVPEVVARLEAAPSPVVAAPPRPHRPRATLALALALLAAAAAIAGLLGSSVDVGVLTRAGAMVHGLIEAGEWWRLCACVFVHVGALHLLVNVLGLWAVGRLAEELFGAWRTVALFGATGVGGALASFLASRGGISAGASGAILGLLGAVFAELTWHRAAYQAAWRRGVWGSLLVVTIAQLGVDFVYPVIDQWAHGGGLLLGVVGGALLSPRAPWARAGAALARALAVAAIVGTVAAGALVLRTGLGDSLARAPLVARDVGDARLLAPATWRVEDGELVDEDLFIVVAPRLEPAPDGLASRLAAYAAGEPARALGRRFDVAAAPAAPAVPLPPGWVGSELAVAFSDPLGGRQRFRVLVVGRAFGARALLASVYVPERVAREAAPFVARLVAGLAPR